MNINNRKKIRVLVMDIDGTLTDGKIYMGNSGELMKAFNAKDGCGIKDILPQYNIVPMIVTGRVSAIAEQRCKELGIKYLYQGVKDKLTFLDKLLKDMNLTFEEVAYIGDDILDLECMQKSGVSACPKDAVKKILENADYVAEKKGGEGAVREFIDWLVV
mgnify:CR=1 FL=1